MASYTPRRLLVSKDIHENEIERSQHNEIIKSLANDSGFSEEEVSRLYNKALQELNERARIKVFLSILAAKAVKELLSRG